MFGYCLNDPINLADPKGLYAGAGIAALLGATQDALDALLDAIQAALGAMGLVPGTGGIYDWASAFISAARGDAKGAVLDAASAVFEGGGQITGAIGVVRRGSSIANSRVLARNLVNAGVPRPSNTAAHHIVAGNDVRAAAARDVLQREGIDINDAANGVFLPSTQSVANPSAMTHSTLPTDRQLREVNRLVTSASPGTVSQVLATIREQLLNGTFPR